MVEVKHSALPWRVRVHPQNEDHYFIEAAKNDPSHPYNIEIMGQDTGQLYPEEQKRADAAFIVKAVNAHGDLVAALRLAQEHLELFGSFERAGAPLLMSGVDGTAPLRIQITAALAKAGAP